MIDSFYDTVSGHSAVILVLILKRIWLCIDDKLPTYYCIQLSINFNWSIPLLVACLAYQIINLVPLITNYRFLVNLYADHIARKQKICEACRSIYILKILSVQISLLKEILFGNVSLDTVKQYMCFTKLSLFF